MCTLSSLKTLVSALPLLFIFTSCSSVTSKDCQKNMHEYGLSLGRVGSPKKLTDQIRNKCTSEVSNLDLEGFEMGFMQGWREYCLPNNAFDMGKKGDTYISFCPVESESYFRNSFLLGKKHNELKDVEYEIEDQLSELKQTMSTDSDDLDEFKKLQTELANLKKEIQKIEIEGKKNIFNFR